NNGHFSGLIQGNSALIYGPTTLGSGLEVLGTVSVGFTGATKAKLEVNGWISENANSTVPYGVLTPSGAFGGQPVQSARAVSLYADQVIWSGSWMVSSSDERIKNIEGQSDGATDLQTLSRIQITDFRYK